MLFNLNVKRLKKGKKLEGNIYTNFTFNVNF